MKHPAAFLLAMTVLLQVAWSFPACYAGEDGGPPASGRGIPAVAFTAPAATLLNISLVEFRGTVSDNDSVTRVELGVDGANWTAATDLGGAAAFSNWSCTLWVPEGTHNVTARANDTGGNEGRSVLELSIDTIPPALSVDSPGSGFLTNRTMFPVSGTTEPGASVRVGADAATVLANGTFNATVRLTPGSNIIDVRARDPAGNEAHVALSGVLDSSAPFLNAWATVTLTNRSSVPVFGETEPGSTVMVAGRPVAVGELGNFTKDVELSNGMNRVTVSSNDRAGNFNYAIVEIVLDSEPPQVAILGPADLTVVADPVVEVCGTASDQSGITHVQVGVDDLNYTLAGGNTTWRGSVRLTEGAHNISVLVFDRAGNSNRSGRAITYISSAPDLSPPALTIDSPAPDSRAGLRVRVSGQVSDKSGVSSVQVSLNNRTWRGASLNAARSEWSANISLHDGWNTIYVRATDSRGNNATRTVSVEYVAPPAPRAPDYAPYAVWVVVLLLGFFAAYTIVNFWRKYSDQPEPGLGEDEAVVEIPAKGLK